MVFESSHFVFFIFILILKQVLNIFKCIKASFMMEMEHAVRPVAPRYLNANIFVFVRG
jgi:hypothetical protein